MNKRNIKQNNQNKLKKWTCTQIKKHPLLILNPNCTNEHSRTDFENLEKAIKGCPKAIKAAKELGSYLKKFSNFPGDVRVGMYLKDQKAISLEKQLMEILEECAANQDDSGIGVP